MRLFIVILLFAFYSCSQKETAILDWDQDSELTFSLDSLVQEKCVSTDCAKLRLVWPVAEGANFSSKVNEVIAEELTSMMMFGERASLSRDSLISDFFQSYLDFKTDFPEAPGGWEVSIEGKVSYQSDSTLSISFGWMNYMGGAHPNHGQDFLNFELLGGRALSQDQLIRDEEKLLQVAEVKFREFHQVPEGKSLKDDGRFFLPEKGFFLANAMGFENGKFAVVYVPYEIGPYAMGYTNLEFTREELGDLVRW